MRSKKRKKEQKKINKYVRAINKNIENDSLWRGRFFCHQVAADWYEFQDKSGGLLTAWIELRDKKTYQTKVVEIDNYDCHWRLSRHVNDFIVEDCHDTTWGNRKEMFDDKTDYRRVMWKCHI